MNKMIKITLILFTLLITSSCSTIVSDSDYNVSIMSNPEGAKYKIINSDGILIHKGITPSIVNLDSGDGYFSKSKYKLVFEKDGYESSNNTLKAKFDGWYVGNIVFGGIIGLLIVDPLTGAMWKLPKTSFTSLYPDPNYKPVVNKSNDDIISEYLIGKSSI